MGLKLMINAHAIIYDKHVEFIGFPFGLSFTFQCDHLLNDSINANASFKCFVFPQWEND